MSGGPPELHPQSPLEEEDRSPLTRVPVFPLPNVVLFPQQVLPLYIFEQRYRKMINDALDGQRLVGMSLMKPGWEEEGVEPEPHEILGVGEITRVSRLAGGNMNIVLHGLARVRIVETVQTDPYLLAEVQVINDHVDEGPEAHRMAEKAKNAFARLQAMKPGQDRQSLLVLKLLASPIDIFNYLCAHVELDVSFKQELLEMYDLGARLRRLVLLLTKDLAILN